MTTTDTLGCQPATLEGAMATYGGDSVFGTSGMVTAVVAKKGAE
jgi:hypothetical protein